jgi:hypothetical protein
LGPRSSVSDAVLISSKSIHNAMPSDSSCIFFASEGVIRTSRYAFWLRRSWRRDIFDDAGSDRAMDCLGVMPIRILSRVVRGRLRWRVKRVPLKD